MRIDTTCVAAIMTAALISSAGAKAMAAKSDLSPVAFRLSINSELLAKKQAEIDITVPSSMRKFEAPKWYGGAPMFLKFVSNIAAIDNSGTLLQTKIVDNAVEVQGDSKAASYTLHYTYNIPQSLSGEVDFALPVLNENYARFDNNLTFLEPQNAESYPATLSISAPPSWRFKTGWGATKEIRVPRLSELISGMIVMGHYDYSSARVGKTNVEFAIFGDYSHKLIRKEFCKVLKSQQEIAGDLPSRHLLVSFIPTSMEACKGTSLTNALNVNIPLKEKLSPFNFAVVGTASHELFHQWNLRYAGPKSKEGIYLLTEGFTNYFSVAALVKAGLINEERFGRFLCRYRELLTENPRYPGADYATIQAGLEKDPNLFDLCYTKGPFVAMLLDLAIREDSGNNESLGSWFRTLCKKYGGSSGYELKDLRDLLGTVSGKPNGQAVKTFDTAFLGGQALNLDQLFAQLGVSCEGKGKSHLVEISPEAATTRSKLFSAQD